jgi:hypothetical protein
MKVQDFDEFEVYCSRYRVAPFHAKIQASSGAVRGSPKNGHHPRPKRPNDIKFGDTLMAPNELLSIENARTVHHPCACLCEWGERSIALLVGTDGQRLNPRYRSEYVCVDATPDNGLEKFTAFKRKAITRPFRPVARLYPEWHLGRLDDAQRAVICNAVIDPESTEGGRPS